MVNYLAVGCTSRSDTPSQSGKVFIIYHQVKADQCDRNGYMIFVVKHYFQRIQVFTYLQFILTKLASNVIFRQIIL